MKKFSYKWVIVALCFLMTFITLGFCSSTKSLFIGPITEYLKIERGVFSLNDSLRFISTALVNVFFGAIISGIGERRAIALGFISMIASMLCYSLAENVWIIYLGGILLGVGFCFTGTTVVGYVVNKWVKKNRGTIMGAVLAANGVGGALAMQIVSPIIERGATGYKLAYLVIAGVLLVAGVLIVSLFRTNPPREESSDVKVEKKKSRGQAWEGLEYSEIKRKGYFYATLVCVFFTGCILMSINGVAVQHMKDVGISPEVVTNIWSVHSLCLAFFKFSTGFLYDKFGLRTTVNICTTTAVIVMVVLASVSNSIEGLICAIIYSVFSGLALPLETIMLPIYAGDLFGDKAYAKVLGMIVSANTIGYAVGTPLMNLSYDILGTYRYGLLFCAALMVFVIVALQIVISKGNKIRREFLEREKVIERI